MNNFEQYSEELELSRQLAQQKKSQLEAQTVSDEIAYKIQTELPGSENVSLSLSKQLAQQKATMRDDRIRASITYAMDKDPEMESRVQTYAQQNNVAPDVVRQNFSTFLFEEEKARINRATANSPTLAEYYSDPNFVAVAKDDVGILESISQTFSATTEGLGHGVDLQRQLELSYKEVLGTITPVEQAQLEDYRKRSKEFAGKYKEGLPSWFKEAASVLGMNVESFSDAAQNEGLLGLGTGATLGATLGTIGGPGAPATVPAGASVFGTQGFITGTTAGYLMNTYEMSVGEAYEDLREFRGPEGATIDPLIARYASLIVGVPNAALETFALGKALKLVPGYEKLAGYITKDQMKRVLTRPTMRKALRDITLKYGDMVATETFTEGFQKFLVILARETAQEFSEGEFGEYNSDQLQQDIGDVTEEATAAFKASVVLGGFGGGFKAYQAQRDVNKANQNRDVFLALADNAKASKLRERMPKKFEEFIKSATKDGPVQNVYVDADRFNELFQSRGVDPAQAAREMGAKNYEEAYAAGTDVVIPIEKFATNVAPSDYFNDIVDDVRLNLGDKSVREAQESLAEQQAQDEEMLMEAKEASGQIQTPELQAIKKEFMEHLIAGGTKPQTAETQATLYASKIKTLAIGSNMSPMEIHSQFELIVSRPLPDALTQKRQTDIQLDPLIDRLRAGDRPTQREVYGESLIDFLVGRGGLMPSGELMDVEKQRRGLIKPTGLSPDDAASMAVQAGYLPGRTTESVTPDDLFEAVLDEIGGGLQFAEGQVNEQLRALETQLGALEEYLNSININLAEIADNAEVRRLMDQAMQAVEDPEIQDALNRLFQAIPQEQVLFQSGRVRDDYTIDMFGVPEEEGARAKPDEPELPFTEDEVPGTFAARTEVVKESVKDIGEPIVQTEEQAAQALAYLARGADERFDALITDKDGKPLAIVGSFKGTYNQAAVYPATLTSEAFRIKGAANIWFAHNHPSGNAKLSQSDIRLHKRLIEAFRGSAIEPRGLFAIGGKSGKGREWTMVDVDDSMMSSVTGAPRTGVEVPVVERILTMEDRLGPQIKNPEMAETAVVEVSGGENGVVLLDAQNRPLAFVPVDPAEASQLRVPGRMDQLYRAISMANPSAAMIANSGMSDAMARNVAGLFGSLDIRVLDVIEIENGVGKSRAKSGYTYTEDTFMQGEAADRRGAITFGPSVPGKKRKFNMKLFENADLSTFVHELGHFYLEVVGDLAERAESTQQLKDDYAKILKFLGAESRADITLDGKTEGSAEYNRAVEMHEKFARANEAYLLEGKAPSVELRSVFQRIRSWMLHAYKILLKLPRALRPEGLEKAIKEQYVGFDLSDEVRAVFDRIYATHEEIQTAKSEMQLDPLFVDATAAGMTEAEFEAYRASVSQATESGKEALQQKLMNQLMRERKAWWKKELEAVRKEVAAEIDALPIYQAFKELTTGETKLDRDELVGRYGKEYLKRLPRAFGTIYRAEGGLPLDAAARLLGYNNGDQLIEALVNMRPRKEYIEAEADRVMKERHGDMLTDGSITDEAIAVLHNEHREKVLAAELRALRRKQREVRPFVQAEREKARQERRAARQATKIPPMAAFRKAAKETIAKTKIRDLEPQKYLNAQRKQGRKAFDAMSKGDYIEAAEAKQREILNHFLYLEAKKARESSDKIAKNMAKFDKKETRQRIGKAGKTYLEQIDAILDGYEFRRISFKAMDRRAKLVEFVSKQEAEGEPVNIPQSVLDDTRQINYRDLTVTELESINEAVQNIAHLARLKNRLLLMAEKRELNEVASEAIAQIKANAKKGKQRTLETGLPGQRFGRWAKGFMLIHTKFSTIFRQMDGWKDGGTMWELFVRPLNERADWETSRKSQETEKLSELFRVYRGTDLYAKKFVPGLNESMSLQGRLMVALNWGRAENRQRLIGSGEFTQTDIDAILDSLDERDWTFVKSIWAHMESFWPEISSQYEKLYGVPPTKSDAISFETKYGTMPGGYFPIKYDPQKSAQAQFQTIEETTDLMKSGAYVRSMTRNGFTKETLQNLDRAVKLDFSTIYEHTAEVIHDLALREYLIDFNKIMAHRVNGQSVKDTINDYYGDQVLREIFDTIRDVTAGDIVPQNAFESGLGHLRAGTSIAFMGWNAITAAIQILGFTQSMVRIGPKWVAKGIKKWGSNAVQLQSSTKIIYEKSSFMRTRYLTQNREINEIRNKLKRQGRFPIFKEGYGAIEDSFFYFIAQMQKTVDVPTWFGAYEKALAEGADEKKAVALADQAVIDSQASGMIKDLAKIERGTGLMKIWTVFYSYFNTTLQRSQEAFGKTNYKNPFDIGRLAVDLVLLWHIPAVLGYAMREALCVVSGGCEDKTAEELMKGALREQVGYLMGMFVGVRELSTILDPRFDYSGPAGVRLFAEATKLATQISQGEMDEALRKRIVTSAGILLHFPATQLNRILDGFSALEEGRTQSPAAVIFGLPRY